MKILSFYALCFLRDFFQKILKKTILTLMVKLLQYTLLQMTIESELFEYRGWLMQIWKLEIMLCNRLEYEDFKMNVKKFRKVCIAQIGNKM